MTQRVSIRLWLFVAAMLMSAGVWTPSDASAKDFAEFNLNMTFYLAVPDAGYDGVVSWLKDNIATAEKLFSNRPKLKINPKFERTKNARIVTRVEQGKEKTFLGFDNAHDLTTFMDNNYDNYARTQTDGHMTVLVVNEVVKNVEKDKGLCGRATFPHWVNPFSRKVGMLLATCETDAYLLSHELGHYFSLKHSFEPYFSLDLFSQKNCNKEFGNHTKCNSCQGLIQPTDEGEPKFCQGTSNVMDYCGSTTGSETLNACQLVRSSNQRNNYLTNEGLVNYQRLAGLLGKGGCEVDADCDDSEFCTAGVLNLARNICKPLHAHGELCTDKRQCATGRCSWGFCADADECQADSDCTSSQSVSVKVVVA